MCVNFITMFLFTEIHTQILQIRHLCLKGGRSKVNTSGCHRLLYIHIFKLLTFWGIKIPDLLAGHLLG